MVVPGSTIPTVYPGGSSNGTSGGSGPSGTGVNTVGSSASTPMLFTGLANRSGISVGLIALVMGAIALL